MSVVYEARYPHDGSSQAFYPSLDDDHHDTAPDSERFADPTDSVVSNLATIATFNAPSTAFVDTDDHRLEDTQLEDHRVEEPHLESLPSPPKDGSPTATTPQRIKAIPKPDRAVVKNAEGKYVCSWPDCAEDVREFGRKCEWNKHMDKHDRPYKCAAEGCEKLPGFTYSGGLLRHEREVHGKHGGPKNSFYCPHINCKRHTGKGFSRLENLNEHQRRVHTQNGAPNGTEGETDDAASDTAAAVVAVAMVGQKRKREPEESGIAELREELKRMRQENEELKKQVNAQNLQTVAMMQKIAQLTNQVAARMAVQAQTAALPTATMI
ncbi:hypothetical protein B0H66DRAFT_161577 [Apodospora peruviana]|uniref:C2H2-type domain-containing protein n=1 Tax=Apodospora peruviana TaxID=516989 RepID=A0AAE0IJW0_9PEZI|nr:hypothetical protein B0H66DRAFT_161577 [Apodospora peruviana]